MRFTSAITIITLLSAAPIAADDSSTFVGASGSGSGRQRRLSSKVETRQREGRSPQHIFRNSNEGIGIGKDGDGGAYEVWGCDQSNSVAGELSPGVNGSFLWIWDSDSIQDQVTGGADAKPLSCTPNDTEGPCDLLDIFPRDLKEVGTDTLLEDLPAFGRLHGVIKDPSTRYVTANIFTPTGGYVGVMDTETKEAIALFRVTATTGNASQRSVHMSFWATDGSAIIVDNLHGKMIERIDVVRDDNGKIIDLVFNKSAGVYLGKDFSLQAGATAFYGNNAFGNSLIGSVGGDYDEAGK